MMNNENRSLEIATCAKILETSLSDVSSRYKDTAYDLFFLQNGGDPFNLNSFHSKPSHAASKFLEQNKIEDDNVIALPEFIQADQNKKQDETPKNIHENNVIPKTNGQVTQDQAKKNELTSSSKALVSHESKNEKNEKPPMSAIESVLTSNKLNDHQRSAYVEKSIQMLRKQGLWTHDRLPRLVEPPVCKTHWDYLLNEMEWLATDFVQERKWKIRAAAKISRAVRNYHRAQEEKKKKQERAVYLNKRKTASKIARMVLDFWDGINRVVQYKHKSLVEEKRQEILDCQLNFIVGQTEKYSDYLTKQLQGSSNATDSKTGENDVTNEIEEASNVETSKVEQEDGSIQEVSKALSSVEVKQPAETMTQSTNVDKEPADIGEEPADIDKEPADDDKEPAENNKKPTEIDKKPTEIDKEPDEIDKEPANDDKEPADTNEIPADIDKEPADVDKQPADIDKEPVDDDKEPDDTDKEPADTNKEPADDDDMKSVETELKITEKERSTSSVRRSTRKRAGATDDDERKAKIAKKEEVVPEQVDDEFKVDHEQSEDDEETLLEQEKEEVVDHEEELKTLNEENDMPIEELLKLYGYSVPDSPPTTKEEPIKTEDSKPAEDGASEDEGEDEAGLAILVDDEAKKEADQPEVDKTKDEGACQEEEMNSVFQQARDIQPTGHTLATTQVKTPIPKLLRGELREYQHVGLNWLVTLYNERLNGILADEMGLGKTIQTIALLAHLACEKGVWGPHLIVVPTSVMLNWEMEFKKWCPGFKILTYYGTQKERKMKRAGWRKSNAFHVCITSYKLVVQDLKAFRRRKWRYMILDEAHNIKNFKSQRWQVLINFNTQRRLLLTGTPLQNSLMELWSLMHFLMPHLFQSRDDFKEWFANPVNCMLDGDAAHNASIIKRLHKVLRPFLLRRVKKEVEKQMPNKYEHVIRCHLSKRQRYLYEDFMSRAATKDTLAKGDFMSVINVLMQLRKVCNHPNLFEPRPIVTSFITEPLVYRTSSMYTSMTIKEPFHEFHVEDYNLQLQNFDNFSTHDVRLLQTLQPSKKLMEDLSSSPHPSSSATKKIEVSSEMKRRILNKLSTKKSSSIFNKDSNSIPTATKTLNSKLISITTTTNNDSPLKTRVQQYKPTTTAARRVTANGQIIHFPGRIQIYKSASGSRTVTGTLFDRTKSPKRLDSESYTKWLARVQQTRKSENFARLARQNERRCDMSNQIFGSNLIHLLQNIVHGKKKNLYDNRYYDEITTLTTNLLLKKITENRTLEKIDILVPRVESSSIRIHESHPKPWKEYSLKLDKEKVRNYFAKNFPEWKYNNNKLLFPETQLIEYDCGKLQILNVLLRNFEVEKHRVLIFTQMTKVLDILEVFLNYHGYRYLRLDGSTNIEERMRRMERFNNDKRIFCFILSTRSGGIGVNLTGADTVVFYDSDWNPTMDAQAQDRCHRIGQTRDVHIYRLISERTIEENILKKANQKKMLNNLAIEGGNFTTAFFTKQGIKDIFAEPSGLETLDEDQKPKATPEENSVSDGDAFETALQQNEDREDREAADRIKQDQLEELEEFGENPLQNDPSTVTASEKIEALYGQLSSIERYAVDYIERYADISFDDQLHIAQEELERAKKNWEISHLISMKEQEERRLEEEDDDIFYVYSEDVNQVSKKRPRKRGRKSKNPSDQICFPDMVTSESGEDELTKDHEKDAGSGKDEGKELVDAAPKLRKRKRTRKKSNGKKLEDPSAISCKVRLKSEPRSLEPVPVPVHDDERPSDDVTSNEDHEVYNNEYMGQKSDPLWLEYGVLDMMSNKWSSSEEDEEEEEEEEEMRVGELGWSDIEREREQNSRTERLLQTAQERQYDYGPNEITSFSRSGRARKKNKWLHDDCYEVYVNTGVPRSKGSYDLPSHLSQPTLNIVVETPDSPPSASPPQHYTNKKVHKKTTSTRAYALPPRHHQTDSRNVFSTFSFDDEDHVTTPPNKKRNTPSTIVSIIPETSSNRFQSKTSNTAIRSAKKNTSVPVSSKSFNIVKVKSLPTQAKIKPQPQPQVVIKRAVNLSIPPIRIITTNGQSPRTLPNIVAFTTSHQTVPVQQHIVTTCSSTQAKPLISKTKVCNRANSIDEKPSFFESLDEMVRANGVVDAVDDDDIITLNLEPVNFGANGAAVTNSAPEDDFAPENEDERNFFQSFESLLQS